MGNFLYSTDFGKTVSMVSNVTFITWISLNGFWILLVLKIQQRLSTISKSHKEIGGDVITTLTMYWTKETLGTKAISWYWVTLYTHLQCTILFRIYLPTGVTRNFMHKVSSETLTHCIPMYCTHTHVHQFSGVAFLFFYRKSCILDYFCHFHTWRYAK